MLRKMFAFGLLSAVVLQAGMQGVETASAWVSKAKSPAFSQGGIVFLFVNILAPQNGYFVLKVMQAAFLGNIVRTLRLGDLILCPALGRKALTTDDYAKAYEKYPFYFSEEYAYALVIAGFAILFAVSVPIIPPFAAMYFGVKYYCDRATLADCYPRSAASDLRLVPTVVHCTLTCVTIFQLFGVCGLAAFKTLWDVVGVATLPPLASAAMHVWLWRETRALLGPRLIEDIARRGEEAGLSPQGEPSLHAALRAALGGAGGEGAPLLRAQKAAPSEVSMPPVSPSPGDEPGEYHQVPEVVPVADLPAADDHNAAAAASQEEVVVVAAPAGRGAYISPCEAYVPPDTAADVSAIRNGRWLVAAAPERAASFAILPAFGDSPFF